jgi:hypothetical protein
MVHLHYPERIREGAVCSLFTFNDRIRNISFYGSRSVAYRAIVPDYFEVDKIMDLTTLASLMGTGYHCIHGFSLS